MKLRGFMAVVPWGTPYPAVKNESFNLLGVGSSAEVDNEILAIFQLAIFQLAIFHVTCGSRCGIITDSVVPDFLTRLKKQGLESVEKYISQKSDLFKTLDYA